MLDLQYTCLGEYLSKLKKLDIYATQVTSGKFLCQYRELQLPKLIVGDRFISTGLRLHTMLKQDCFYIILPNNNHDVSINGHLIDANQPIIFANNQEMLFNVPKNSQKYYVIIINSEELAEYYGRENVDTLKKTIETQAIKPIKFINPKNHQQHLCLIIENLLNQSQLLSYQAVFDIQERLIASLCQLLSLSFLGCPLLNIEEKNKPRQLAIVNRALKYIHSNSTLKITIPTLAKASFCCIRSLEYSFMEILKMSPKQYIIKRRLQLIHHDLKVKKDKSIKEIITTYGVVNQGRFAQDYYQFFNEYPHQTRDR
ncbi:AraC family transcriptional regulator [Thalassotalea profundi]|uniref:HTH araC/xylS-type domain-containing protein n=1 Tax=Thalassotalea profundi TaxID=2036687 RepID=A0ABQ3INF7_9GAMM|nr:AraC family transcriptional regulator [Thalassotalea profundi]GHE84797.1 hypothetical protein GCM10011501_12050 [Thalassotalea profundi]